MPSSATPRNRFELQAAGENLNTWGAPKLNQDISMIDASLDGLYTTSASGAVTLTSTNFAPDQARNRVLNVTGGTGVAFTIPSVEKNYKVRNGSSGDVIVTTGASTFATVPSGNIMDVICDGSSVWIDRTTSIPGFMPTNPYDISTKQYVDNAAFSSITNLPGQTGTGGKYLQTDGSIASWQYPLNPWIYLDITSVPYTAVSRDRIETNTLGGAFTMTLPIAPLDGDWVFVSDVGDWTINNLTIARNGKTIAGSATNLICNAYHWGFTLVYNAAAGDWRLSF